METIKERITKFLSTYGISVREFEKKCGLANGYMSRLRMSPSVDKADNILSAYPALSREWLLFGEGEMLKDNISNMQNVTGNIKSNNQGNTTNNTTNNYQGFCEQANKRNDDVIVRMLDTLTEQGKRHLDIIDNAIAQSKELEEIRGLIRQVLDKIDTIERYNK